MHCLSQPTRIRLRRYGAGEGVPPFEPFNSRNAMPARRVKDPLVPLPLRVPASLRAMLEAEAAQSDCTVSDALRTHLTLSQAKPLGERVPRRRLPQRLSGVSGVDSGLLRQLAAIGSNLNQLARVANGRSLAGQPMEALEIIILLRSMEEQIGALAEASRADEASADAH